MALTPNDQGPVFTPEELDLIDAWEKHIDHLIQRSRKGSDVTIAPMVRTSFSSPPYDNFQDEVAFSKLPEIVQRRLVEIFNAAGWEWKHWFDQRDNSGGDYLTAKQAVWQDR